MLLQKAFAPITGWLPPGGMVTSVVSSGNAGHDQLFMSFQSVLVVPSQLPGIHWLMYIVPVEAGEVDAK